MTSLPKEIVDDYLSKHSIPEILSKESIQAHSATVQDLLDHCRTIIDFLEMNQAYNNPYSVQAPAFEPFLCIISQHYKRDALVFEKLIRAEQAIHFISQTVNTQDISPYLDILEDVCNGPHLDELVFLLSKKHCAPSMGFTSSFKKWMKFLTPYLKFLIKMDFDYHRIFHFAEKELLKDYLTELKESLEKRGVVFDGSEVPGQQQFQKIQRQFIETRAEKNDDYYYDLGLMTFIKHLSSFPENQELFKICVALGSYIGDMTNLSLEGLMESESLDILKTLEKSSLVQSTTKLLKELLACHSQNNFFDSLASCLQILMKTNFFDEENYLSEILKITKSEKDLLQRREGPYYGEYITHYDYLLWLVLSIISKGLFSANPDQKEKLAKALLENFETHGLRPYIKEKYYEILHLLTPTTKFIETWNLSKVPFETIITRQDIQEDLFLNLKYSLKFVEEKSQAKELLTEESQIQTFSDLLHTYISTIEAHKHPSSSPLSKQLKIVNSFLLKIFNLNIVFPKALKIHFLHTFTDFIANKCSPNEWDVIDFQTDYWKILQSTSSTNKVVLEKSFQRFFEIVEENLAKASIEANCENQDRSYIREPEISARISNLVLTSLERIESSLTTQWYLINWNNTEKISKLKLDCKIFIYSTQKWLVYLQDKNKIQHAEAFDLSFTNTLVKLSHLYFHPAFLLFIEAGEQKKFLQAYSKIIDGNKCIRWNARIVFFGTLGHRLTFLNRIFSTDIKPQVSQEQVLQLDLLQIKENLFGKSQQQLNKETILYVTVLKRLFQFKDILRGFDGCAMNEDSQNQYVDMLKKLSTPLTEFILNVYSIDTKQPLQSDPLFCATIKGMETLLKPPHSVFCAFDAVRNFFCQLIQNGFRSNLTNVLDKMLKLTVILSEMLKGRLKDALLCVVTCQANPFNLIIKTTSRYIDYKIGKISDVSMEITENDMKRIQKLTLLLTECFHSHFKEISKTLEAYSFDVSTANFEKHLFNSLIEALNSLQAKEIILYQSTQTDEIFVGVFEILEKCWISLKKDVIKRIEPIKNEIVSLENDLAEDYQEFGALFADDDEPVSQTVFDLEEINQKVREKIALKERELEQTQRIADDVDWLFFQNLQYYILIYPFANARKNFGSVITPIQEKSFNELTQFLNNLIQKVPLSTRTGLIQILHFTADNSLNELLTIQGCLNRLLAFLQRPEGNYSIDENFAWNLMSGTNILFSEFHHQTQKFDHFIETLQDLIANICKLILTYLTCKYLNNSAQISFTQEQTKALQQWMDATVNLYCFLSEHPQSKVSPSYDPDFLNIIGILQILSNSSSLDISGPLSTILRTKTKKSWTVTLTYFIACVLEKPLKDGLPEDLLILTQIKKLLSESGCSSLTLTNLALDPLIIEKENTSQERLLTILENKFKINSLQTAIQNPDPANRLAGQNLSISFDLTQEHFSSQSSIEDILGQISPLAHKILQMLLTSALMNHLDNLSNICAPLREVMDDDPKNPSSFKEANSIITTLSILTKKFSYIAAYIAFFRDDYTHLLNNINNCNLILDGLDTDQFKSITFLECLFKLKFFRFHGHSFLMLLKPLISPSGILYRDPESPDTLVDISTIAAVKCLELIGKEVTTLTSQDDSLDPVETYLISKFSIAALGYINSSIQQPLKKSKLLSHLENLIKNTLQLILKSLKFLFRSTSFQHDVMEDILAGLHTNFFDSQYSKFCNQISLSSARIDTLKFDHYQEFLINPTEAAAVVDSPENLKTTLETAFTKIKNINQDLAQANLQRSYMQERLIKIFKRENNQNEITAFPFTTSSSMYGNVTWFNYLKAFNSNISNFSKKAFNDSPKNKLGSNYSSYIATNNFELPSEKTLLNLPNLYNMKSVPFLDVAKVLMKLHMLSRPNDTQFSQALSQNLIQKSLQQDALQQTETSANASKQQEETKTSIKSIKTLKYFVNPSIKSETDLQNAETQLKIKIKLLCEKILIEIMPLLSSQQKQVIAEKVSNELSTMDEFECSLFLCHLGQYQIFADFEFPKNFTEILEEFAWIHNNINSYLEMLQDLPALVSQPNLTPQTIDDPSNLESLDELTFCKSYDLNTPPTGQIVTPFDPNLKKNLNQLHSLYPIDDSVVESLLSSFYLDFSSQMPAALTGLLNELCNSALFQIKLMDFCFFILYSPNHVNFLNTDCFPYTMMCNPKSNSKVPIHQNYSQMTKNVLIFLLQHVKQKLYLVCQPIIYLSQYGLKSLQELKLKTNYKDMITKEYLSIGDLLIGLLEIREINSNATLLQELQSLLKTVFTQKVQFRIWDLKKEEEQLDTFAPFTEKRMLTVKSSKAMLKMSPIDFILKDLENIAIYGFEIILQNLAEKIVALQKPIDQMNALLKSSLNTDPINISENDLKPLFDLTKTLELLAEILTFICSIFLAWDSNDKGKSETSAQIKQQQDKAYIKALNHLTSQILTEPTAEDFIIHLFELLNYLASPSVAPFKSVALLLPILMRSCLQFYALLCCKNKILDKQQEKEEIPSELPKFAQVISHENVKERESLPGLEQTFSNLRRSREFDFDVLVTDMCKKHQNSLEKAFFASYKKTDAISFLSQRVPWILDFTLKYKMFMDIINKDLRATGCDGTRCILINRKKLLQSTLSQFSNLSLKDLRKRITVSFKDEYGSDAGGVRREWYTIVCQELFNPNYGLFEISKNGFNIQPCPLSTMIPSRLKYFQLAGILLAKVIQEGFVADVNFTKPFLKHILTNRNLAINDLADIDAELHKSLEWILSNSVDELEQNFTYDIQIFDNNTTKELLAEGYDKIMNDENKKEFVKRICQAKMQGEIEQELSAFLEGFYMILSKQSLDIFSPSELQLLISGAPTIEIEQIKHNAQCSGYNSDDDIIKWLWEILQEFSQKELAAFVFFITGSLRIPVGQKKHFTFSKYGYGVTRLPISHTCSWHIEIPPYPSKEEFRLKLLMAIFEGQGSFMLS